MPKRNKPILATPARDPEAVQAAETAARAVNADAASAAARATESANAKRDAIARAASAPSAASIEATRKPGGADKPKRGRKRAKPETASTDAASATTEAEAPKRPSHRDNIAAERYTGASKPIRRGFRLSPVMLNKSCNGLSDRTRAAMLDLRDAYRDKPFKRHDYDAGILGFLCYLGYAEHVAGTGTIKRENGNVYACGSDAEFRLTKTALDYGNAAKATAKA